MFVIDYIIAHELAHLVEAKHTPRFWNIVRTQAPTIEEEGFARLPRRRDEERPPGIKPEPAKVADVRQLDLAPRSFRTRVAGLFLFVPLMRQLPGAG